MQFQPRPYQPIVKDFILQHDRCMICVPMGMGKTSSTLMALDILSMADFLPALVIAPLRVARSVWSDEVRQWDDFNHFKIVPIIGEKEKRKNALLTSADIHTINYENIPWLIDQNYWPWKTIVADESTRLKSFRLRQGGKQPAYLAKKAWSKTERFIELTGTPMPNGLKDLWGQYWFLDKGQRLGHSYTAYIQRWFRYPHPDAYEVVPMPHAQAEITERIKDITLSLDVKDWFDVKEPIVNDIYVELPGVAREVYKRMEKEMFAEIESAKVEAFSAASKSLKCLQIASGAVYTEGTNNREWKGVHDEKLDALESIINEANGANIVVCYFFQHDLARLKKRFPYGRELDNFERTLRAWNKGEVPLLFLHPASAGHGLNLQRGGNILVFFSQTWNLEHRMQVIERIGPVRQMQAGYDRPVFIYNILARNTIDEIVMERVKTKRAMQDLLLEAARKRR